jgi:hypothetical protein
MNGRRLGTRRRGSTRPRRRTRHSSTLVRFVLCSDSQSPSNWPLGRRMPRMILRRERFRALRNNLASTSSASIDSRMDRCCFRLVLLVELRAYADFYVIAAPKHRHDRPPSAITLVPIGVTEGIPDSEQSRRRLWAIRWPRVCKPVKVVCIAASSLELGAIGNAAPMKTDVVFRTHQEVGFRSLNAVAELTHLRPVALLWGAARSGP